MSTDNEEKPKTRLRGMVRCEECGWYIGRNMLRRTEGQCCVCDHDMTKQENYKR